ncbi:hypothetical protein B0H10DRAFT_2068569 [Mycena sp. CBHHK59/15]|nr:hypothetical protein B0H10DRAFT_2068569 [Mycena sp. CBHHK59/15]
MPPKSSASAGTRKKHARKAAGPVVEVELPREKKTKKNRSDPPRPKVYVAPVKPSAAQPDPLETTGLAHRLPPDLLVVLRSLGKKAPVTKVRALEELQSAWVDRCGDEDESVLYTMLDMLPVWQHHLAAHLVYPSRRIRLLTATIHAALLRVPLLRDRLTEDASENAAGTWALAAHDVDRAVAALASGTRTPPPPDVLLAFIERTLMHPDALYTELNPPPPTAPPPPPLHKHKRPTGIIETPPPRTKAEELDESETDRRARLRIAAFGALKYLLETTSGPPPDFLTTPTLWSALHHAAQPPFLPEPEDGDDEQLEGGFGYAQPALRKAAWGVLPALLAHRPLAPALVHTLAAAVLRSAWVEPDVAVQGAMWGGVLGFLKDHPTAWCETLSAYNEFRVPFLERACGGAPVQAYPSVVVVLSTIPSEILAPVHELFAAFWAPVDPESFATTYPPQPSLFTSALPHERARAGAAFLSALLECVVFVLRRGGGVFASRAGEADHAEEGEVDGATVSTQKDGQEGHRADAGPRLLAVQLRRVWGALSAPRKRGPLLHVEPRRAAGLLRRAVLAGGGVSDDLLAAGLEALSACVMDGWAVPGDAALACATLEAFVGGDEEAEQGASVEARVRARGWQLMTDVLGAAVRAEDSMFLVRALHTFGDKVFLDAAFAEAMDALLARRAYALLLTAPPLLFAYLETRVACRQALFRTLLADIARHPESAPDALRILVAPDAARALTGLCAVDADEGAGPLDGLFVGRDALMLPVPVLAPVLRRAGLFLSRAACGVALGRVVDAFATRVEAALTQTERIPLDAFDADLELLGDVLAGRPEVMTGEAAALFPAVYVFAYVLPRAYLPGERQAGAVATARNIWVQWLEGGETRGEVLAEVKRRLGVIVCSTDVWVTPEDMLRALAEGTLGLPIDVVADVFPSKEELDDMLDALPADPLDASLAVLHPLLPPASAIESSRPASSHDERGYTSYARIVAALLQTLVKDRRIAKENVWALRHIISLAIYAEDLLAVPAATSPVFASSTDVGALEEIGKLAQQVTTYLLTASIDDGWRTRVLTAITQDKSLAGGGALPSLFIDLIRRARSGDGSRDCRVLGRVLRHSLHDADKTEADLWILFARKIEKTAPETCITIVFSISDSTLEPPRLDRYRNELAADLLGVPASKVNTQGLLTLRKLAASAPDVDSDVVFLPQQRSVNIFKACQQWVASDEDIEEEVESAMTLVFFYLAPLLQNVPGTHWDLIYDVLESNLENSELTDDATLVTLARTLRLIILIQDLALTNKALRASWEERQMQILTMVRDLAAAQLDGVVTSSPRSTCRELVLSIVQDLPTSLINEDTLPKMCHLLADPSVDVQKMTYQILQVAARKRTEHFVIESGVDVEGVVKADLPLELLDILQTSLNFNQGDLLDINESIVFGYLLGWMVVFDLFVDASLKVRLSYIDQLRTLDIIGTSFIPNLLTLLGVDQGIPKSFKLDVWAVDEYFVQLYESGSPWSFQVLAAHLYYRALLTVPSLIYNWVLDCKDRQLSSSIATYTSLHFSPVIIRAELAHVKSPAAIAELVDDNLSIKVAPAVNEVVASYLVDEHQLEIKLKIPSDWPLHKIEVKDVQRVGVEETRWRAWILAVQQTLWSQNGRIVDGIGLFKKNVTLHFEGQVECAICYSIISVMDGSLPRKPCKTCKNRFHSGCLYKWFSSSHSSSCPLCRSDII